MLSREMWKNQVEKGIVELEACETCGRPILTDNGVEQLEAHIEADRGFDAGEFSGAFDYYADYCQRGWGESDYPESFDPNANQGSLPMEFDEYVIEIERLLGDKLHVVEQCEVKWYYKHNAYTRLVYERFKLERERS